MPQDRSHRVPNNVVRSNRGGIRTHDPYYTDLAQYLHRTRPTLRQWHMDYTVLGLVESPLVETPIKIQDMMMSVEDDMGEGSCQQKEHMYLCAYQ